MSLQERADPDSSSSTFGGPTLGMWAAPATLIIAVRWSALLEVRFVMMGVLRKLRGLFGVGATWGALWGLIGAGVGVVIGLVRPEVWSWTNPIIEWALGIGLYGFVSGVGFGTLLALGEGRSTLLDLSLKRSVAWGVLGAIAVPLLFGALGTFEAGTTVGDVVGAILVTGSLGGIFAPASIAAARSAELRARGEAPMLSDDPGELALPDRASSG